MKVTEESVWSVVVVALILAILFILINILTGNKPLDVFDIFKSIMRSVYLKVWGHLAGILKM